MESKQTLYDLVPKMEGGENVEILEIEVMGQNPVLLRNKEMPEFAFLVWPEANVHQTYTQFIFRLRDYTESEKYTVLSGGYSSEALGLESIDDDKTLKEFCQELTEKFKTAISEACEKNNVQIVFVERAEAWNSRYKDIQGVVFMDISDHQDAMLDLYGRRKIRECLRFIDYSKSRGHWGNLL